MNDNGVIIISIVSVGEWVVPSAEFLVDATTGFNNVLLSSNNVVIELSNIWDNSPFLINLEVLLII